MPSFAAGWYEHRPLRVGNLPLSSCLLVQRNEPRSSEKKVSKTWPLGSRPTPLIGEGPKVPFATGTVLTAYPIDMLNQLSASQNSLDWGQSQKIGFSKFPGSGLKKIW